MMWGQVSWDRASSKWRSRFCHNSHTAALGYFSSAAAAAAAYDVEVERRGLVGRKPLNREEFPEAM